jgi:CheY-like chemotaxis protein
MINNNLLCLYHPTTILLIDDDEIFLNTVSLKIDYNTPFKIFQDASEALQYIGKSETHDKFISTITNEKTDIPLGIFSTDFGIYKIYHDSFNPRIFDIISVVVVDLDMPGISGIEVLENLAGKNCKKILLTGKADGDYAVKLFNSNMINKFIQKGTPFIENILNESVRELQSEYFQDITKTILTKFPKIREIFSNQIIKDLFNDTVLDKSVSSYYLMDTSGSFILFDDDSKYYFLLLRSEEELFEIGKQIGLDGAPETISTSVKNGEKIAFFGSSNDYRNAVETGSWEKYLYSASRVCGKTNYRYSIVDKINGFHFNKNDTVSFSEFMKTLDNDE